MVNQETAFIIYYTLVIFNIFFKKKQTSSHVSLPLNIYIYI